MNDEYILNIRIIYSMNKIIIIKIIIMCHLKNFSILLLSSAVTELITIAPVYVFVC